jgi:hypothetical protein
METLKLTKTQAIQYYNSSNDKGFKELLEKTFGKDFAKSKEIWEKVNNLETLTEYLGHNPLIYPNPTNSFEKYINACSVLVKVAKTYNEGTILDWKNINIYKYLPYKYNSSSGFAVCSAGVWVAGCAASAFLYYKNSNLSTQSYNNFKDYWEDFWAVEKV